MTDLPTRARRRLAARFGSRARGQDMGMTFASRALVPQPVAGLEEAGAGAGLAAALRLGPAATIDELEAAGLRGRGGAGFPIGRKWRTVAAYDGSSGQRPTVVVNAAEGEPGSFKDRSILRHDPYRVLEGALVAAHTIGADTVVVGLKRSFGLERARVDQAMEEIRTAGWSEGIELRVHQGPDAYLFGEETGLLESIAGRDPFPRVAPPFRHGAEELGDGAGGAADLDLAAPSPATAAPPALVNNVETLANVPAILANGADWFRGVGTEESPGTVVCTVTGHVRHAGVGEVVMGTPLVDVIEQIGGGIRDGGRALAVVSGVANPLLPGTALDTAVSHEALAAAGSGLGAAGFIVFDEATDVVAVASGVARFLAVESCGQCTPCKRDGLALVELFDPDLLVAPGAVDQRAVRDRLGTVADGARCNLASQQQAVIGSMLDLFPDAFAVNDGLSRTAPEPIVPILDIVDGRAVYDTSHHAKQPDWSFDAVDSGKWPAAARDERAQSSV